MPSSYVSNTMPISPRQLPNQRPNSVVNMRLVLEPKNSRHYEREVRVTKGQYEALNVANQAIRDTRRILNMGSGDQLVHTMNTEGETFKRTTVSRNNAKVQGLDNIGKMWEAARYRAGNCGEMALICAQLIASSSLGQPVAAVDAQNTDHSYVIIGNPNSKDERVIVDPWPLFSRAMLEKDFVFNGHYDLVERFTPNQNPSMRERLMNGETVSKAVVDREFANLDPVMSQISDKELLDHGLKKGWFKTQFHSSKNLGVFYQYKNSNGEKKYVDQDMTKEQYEKIYNGPQPSPDIEVPAASSSQWEAPPRPTAPQRSRSQRGRPPSSTEPEITSRLRRMSLSGSSGARRPTFVEPPPARSGPSRPPITRRPTTTRAGPSRRYSVSDDPRLAIRTPDDYAPEAPEPGTDSWYDGTRRDPRRR